ncbi:MAG TPA: pseudouridine synthase, partial [Phycisphaeraceae bacterium]
IAQGRVSVNGYIITELPVWVDPQQDRIEVNGQPLTRPRQTRRASRTGRAAQAGKHYVMLHKPRNVVSTVRDPQGRRTVLDLVHLPDHPRLFPVGRLDADSTGLILLTDDGELANRLTHPRYGVAKTYQASVRGRLTEQDLDRLRHGIYLSPSPKAASAGPRAKRATMEQVRIVGYQRDRQRNDRTQLAITLREGQNRQIRRMLARLGVKVRRLKRVAIGPLQLKGLAVGQWRRLTSAEVKALQQAAGLEPS